MSKRIKHNDLLPWFTDDHRDLPPGYLKSCQKFFDELKASSSKRQAIQETVPHCDIEEASSSKQVTSGPEYDIIKTEREKHENK
jgi:hypothetical protein